MQVMINLVKNAVEACISFDIVSKSNAIEIQSYIAETEQVIIEISNTGNAIPHSDVENIFTPFFTTKEDGSGIGLSISRQIIHSHGGSLVLANNKNGNVLFRITLE
jgi:two-component system sensor kinase FixL